MLEYVTLRVKAAAQQIGKIQSLAMRGQIYGELTWPVFVQGPRFEKAFPEVRIAPVTSDIRSLASHGFRDEIITAWGQSIPSLNSLQFDAVNEYGILEGKHPLVKGVTRRGNVERAAASALW